MRVLTIVILSIFISSYTAAQCYPNRHNTTWFHSWVSCEPSQNPNTTRGKSHWIMYDLGYEYKLKNMHFWNINDPQNLDYGMKTVVMDYSLDGNTWIEYGYIDCSIGTGKSIYSGEDLFNFDGIVARYILITGIENWGGKCWGLSEIKINVDNISATEMVNFQLNCNDINGSTQLTWSLTNENNTVEFEVERSKDGNNWNKVYSTGRLAVKEGFEQYSYFDQSVEEAYYRIKIIDENGNISYSEPYYCSKNNLQVRAFPNPFNTFLEAEILAQNNEPIICKLTDIYGRIIEKKILEPNSRINSVVFKGGELVSGNYFLSVNQGNKSGQIKLTKGL